MLSVAPQPNEREPSVRGINRILTEANHLLTSARLAERMSGIKLLREATAAWDVHVRRFILPAK